MSRLTSQHRFCPSMRAKTARAREGGRELDVKRDKRRSCLSVAREGRERMAKPGPEDDLSSFNVLGILSARSVTEDKVGTVNKS